MMKRPTHVCRKAPCARRQAALFLAITAVLAVSPGQTRAQSTTLSAFNPVDDDNQLGRIDVAPGATLTLSGPQRFALGQTGGQNTTLQQLGDRGRIVSGASLIGAPRLNPGTQNLGITVRDPITGTNRVVSVYDSTHLVALSPVTAATTVPDLVNVGDNQYIDTRVGQVSSGGGTLNVAIGTPGAASNAASNGWVMVAKQSSLFVADGSGTAASTVNWTSRNRITFAGEVADPTVPRSFGVSYVAHYGGTFDVTTRDGVTTSHTVTNDTQLRAYNDFLVAQLRAGKIDASQYASLFARGYTSSSGQIVYGISANDPADDVAQPIGDRIVMRLSGANARGTVAAGAALEAINTNGGAIRAENGARVGIDGILATQHNSGDGSALVLTGSSRGRNNGVIDGNFLVNADGSIVNSQYGSNVVDVQSGSRFTNNGVLNLATGAINGAGKSTGIRLGSGGAASNNGSINVGVTGSRSNGSMDGVYVNTPSSSFTNAATGTIYVGRGPQATATDASADVAVNQATVTTGINVPSAGVVNNLGTIAIGSLTQNAAGILVTSPTANVTNAGTIRVDGRAAAVPRENVGISAINAGIAGSGIVNAGTIDVAGVNNTGLKALSTGTASSLVHSTGTIAVTGGTDPASGTRNYGIWIEGQGTGVSRGDVQGAVNLSGDGAIGVHARGNATVDVGAGAAPRFMAGEDQIGFYAFGDDAHVNVAPGTALDVATARSTLFRLDGGADVDANGLAMTASGIRSTGLLGSGAGVLVNVRGSRVAVSGESATGVLAEGGASAMLDAGTNVSLTGAGAVAGIADGQKHDLSGNASGAPVSTTLANAANITSSAGATGLIARNGGALVHTGRIDLAAGTGILLDAGASSLRIDGGSVAVGGAGNAVENAAETGNVSLRDASLRAVDGVALRTGVSVDPRSTVRIDVDGGGTGYAFRRADGSSTNGDLDVGDGFVIRGNGEGATGILAATSGTVNTGASVAIANAAGGSALVAGTAAAVNQRGVLSSASTTAPVVDLANGVGTSFTNTGTIAAMSPSATAIRGSGGNDSITLASGSVRGDIAAGDGRDTFLWTGGTLDGGLTMGNGVGNRATLGAVDTSTTTHLLAGGGGDTTLTFDGTTVRGGSFAADDASLGTRIAGWNRIELANAASLELTHGLRLAGSDLDIDASSSLRAGNGVHPVIGAASPGGARVTNAGTIDLTNGTGSPGNTLTVDGNYTGASGRVNLATELNAGGALSAQATDRLLVQGDASGETRLHVTPTQVGRGAVTDTDGNGVVTAGEGISVVQVAGASSGGAFRLDGGYLAVGPYQYGLYAFAPGASDARQRVVAGSGNGYWDYRLANVLVCDGPCAPPTAATPAATPPPGQPYVAPPAAGGTPIVTGQSRPAVVPQVPAYIVAPSALAMTSYRTVDNLHRRLGEERDMASLGEGLGGEPFVRYFGGDYSYSTNRSFSAYGYDFDTDVRGAQVGANIFALDADRSMLRAGVAYTHVSTHLDPKAPDGYSHAALDTNSIAMFMTWQHATGFYVDAVAQGDRYAGDVDTARAKGVARVRGSGWSGSVEIGYPFRLDDGWAIEPQLQVIRQHIGLRNQADADEVVTRYDAFGQTVGRAGFRLDRSWVTDGGSTATPYARVNYIKGWGGVSRIDVGAEGGDISQAFEGGRFGRMVEVGLGGTYAWRNRLSVYGEADWQKNLGDAGTRGWSANVGMKWAF